VDVKLSDTKIIGKKCLHRKKTPVKRKIASRCTTRKVMIIKVLMELNPRHEICLVYRNVICYKGGIMIQGIYLASMGMTPLMDKQDQIANNLANIKTTGFKQSGAFIKTYQKYIANDQQQPFVNTDIKTDEVYVDYSPGTMIKTDSPLDVYLQGGGFLTVMTPSGMRYTRNGNFSLDAEGFLVTSDGSKVMGKEGYIKIDKADSSSISIATTGEVFQHDQSRGTLRITDFQKPYKLTREGNSYFKPASFDAPTGDSPSYSIKQGYLESSNVNVIHNMANMISAYRNFEADQKALIAQDETLEKAVNQVGRVQ
jgi:flagellar basal-body rod protein FlgF